MSKYGPKPNNWIDKDSHPYKEDETLISNSIDSKKRCVDSDCFMDFFGDSDVTEMGKNKEIGKIQLEERPLTLKSKYVKMTRIRNKRNRRFRRGNERL